VAPVELNGNDGDVNVCDGTSGESDGGSISDRRDEATGTTVFDDSLLAR